MKPRYLSAEHLEHAIQALRQHGKPVVGISLLVMIRSGVPIDANETAIFGGREETEFLDQFCRLRDAPADKPYYIPFSDEFVNRDYAGSSLQRRRKDLHHAGVFSHPNPKHWGIRPDYVDGLKKADVLKEPVPFWALALWMRRTSPMADVEAVVDEVWKECKLSRVPDAKLVFDRKIPGPVLAIKLKSAPLSDDDLLAILRPNYGVSSSPRSNSDLASLTDRFARALSASHLHFGDHHDSLARTFLASLLTRRFVILTGLSGSGKTQIALRFGDWLGDDRSVVVPVRPDWTSSDPLLGYEDGLRAPLEGRRAWVVPEILEFILRASGRPSEPFLLILDEMNLAHVERYFADILSGMESGRPCIPNLRRGSDGEWRAEPSAPRIPLPKNLFFVGTVNVDETTYTFSPKVLDRANTIEFRVRAEDLSDAVSPSQSVAPASAPDRDVLLAVATDASHHLHNPAACAASIAEELRRVHRILANEGFEFGHRVFQEALRFAAICESAGEPDADRILDLVVIQKLLPRVHGARRRVEPLLHLLGHFAAATGEPPTDARDILEIRATPRLVRSFDKIRRMIKLVRANQFVSFAE